jgi:predicted Zn finger-like uncharacterized protein
MVIRCVKCKSRFNLDESLLSREGSKVRCSLCRHMFVVYPPEKIAADQAWPTAIRKEEVQETSSQDAAPVTHEGAVDTLGKTEEIDFENIFEEALEDLEKLDTVPTKESQDLKKEESARIEERPFSIDSDREGRGEHKAYGVAPGIVFQQEKPAKSHILAVVLVIILLLLGAAGAIFLWAPELIPDQLSFLKTAEKQELTDTGVRRLSFKEVSGSFVESKGTGHLFVIKGMVVNNYQKSRSFILVSGSLLNDKGEVVKKKMAYIGNSLKEDEIKVMPLVEINKAMKNRYGRNGENFNVAPGASVPFTIVFENLPQDLSEFQVEAVSSSPGA